ncbi:MAG: hypothetical protein RBT11_18930 [Desulfobacterales bacterium]|jgi:hypothetical protein|nr:hypothetical protein [Desulfobacterales bacterium]
MLAAFVDKILSLGAIQKTEIGGRIYTKGAMTLVQAPEHSGPGTLKFRTLRGLADYVFKNADITCLEDTFLHVHDFNRVLLQGHLIPAACNTRFLYAEAELHAKSFGFGVWYDLENFIIALQSMFVADDATESLLGLLRHLANEHVVENKDDGFSQGVQIKTGITTKSQVKITNPMTFRPYRTFRDIEQPPSQFIFRLRKGDKGLLCVLFESDGEAWKLDAIAGIKAWLEAQLPEAIVIG